MKTICRRVLACFLIVVCFGVVGFSAGARAGDALDHSHRLGVNDEIEVVVYGEPDLSATYRIETTGTISVPLIGEVTLRGLTLREAEALIEAELADGYLVEPSVSIALARMEPFYIMGEVKVPGRYPYVNDMSVMNAVALAGGFTYRANRKEVEVLRKDRPESSVYDDVPVHSKIGPGDTIIVKERFF